MMCMNLSGKDNMLPSRDEAWRLLNSLQNCKVRYFKDNGHTLLMVGEDFILILSDVYKNIQNLKAECPKPEGICLLLTMLRMLCANEILL